MEFPNDLYYSKEHTWVRIENNIGIIGITEFAQSELGEIVYVDLPNPKMGYSFQQDKVFGSVGALKTGSDLYVPVSGKVIATNETLLQNPTLVNSNPYDEGWLMKVEIQDSNEIKNLLTAEQYAQITNN